MEAYKNTIEEIVHPLGASERRKNTLRRELWAHFCALVEEERRSGVEKETLLDKAFQRLGTTDEIRAAFNTALPRFEVFVYRLDQRIRKRPEETPQRYAWRVASGYFVVSLAFASLIGLLCACLPGPKVNVFRALMPVAAMLTLSVWISAWHVIALSRLPGLERLLRSKEGCTKRVLRRFAVIWLQQTFEGIVLAFVFLILGYLALGWVAGFHNAETLGYLYVAPWLIAFVGFTFTTVLPYALLRDRQNAEHIPGWPYSNYD